MKRAVVIGHRGQDGRILSEILQKGGHVVIGVGRGDLELSDSAAVRALLEAEKPDDIYYLAAHHHSSEDRRNVSDAELAHTSLNVNFLGLVSFLQGMKDVLPRGKLFYAASSHVFGMPGMSPQTEDTPFHPLNIYGISKSAGIEICRYYRRIHGVHASCGILYNHESSYRSGKFVSMKIINGALDIHSGKKDSLTLGDLDARIDWGYAPDYVEAMQAILEMDAPDDFIIATGTTHTVREFVMLTFSKLGLNWEEYVRIDKTLITKKEKQGVLTGDFGKLKQKTGWQPKTDFSEMINLIVDKKKHER